MKDTFRYFDIRNIGRKQKEVPSPRQTGIGKAFERKMSTVSDSALPPRPEGRNFYATFGTNEETGITFKLRQTDNPIDGYIVGVGFGNIFRMFNLLPTSNSLPKAVIATDVMPEVVLAGRTAIKKLPDSKSPEDFYQKIRGITSAEVEEVINEEPNPHIADRLRSAKGNVEELFATGELPFEIGQGGFNRPSIVDLFGQSFHSVRQLASEGNIGLTLMSMTSPDFLAGIRELPDYGTSSNIVYVSNIIDHLTDRGRDSSQFAALEPLKALATAGGSICVDTTQQRLEYFLRVGDLPPRYTEEDFPWSYGY